MTMFLLMVGHWKVLYQTTFGIACIILAILGFWEQYFLVLLEPTMFFKHILAIFMDFAKHVFLKLCI